MMLPFLEPVEDYDAAKRIATHIQASSLVTYRRLDEIGDAMPESFAPSVTNERMRL
jgi:hypothetical protein